MDKKICHITSAHERYDDRIFLKQCKSIAKTGYNVVLFVNDTKDDEVLDGVNIQSTKYKPKNRIERFLYTKRSLLDKAITLDADIYHLHDPDLLPMGNKLKKLGKKIIFDSHEDVPLQIIDKEWIPKIIRFLTSKIYEIYEKHSVKKYDAIISVTPNIVDRFRSFHSNTFMVTNYPVVDENEIIIRTPEKAICFAGGITSQYRHHNILKAIENIDDIKYLLAGSTTKEYLSMLKGLPAWEKVDYVGRIPHSEVKKIYSRSNAGIAINSTIQVKGQGTLGNVKLFEFMEAKLPVICTDYRLWKEIVEGNKCGICVEPDNIEEIRNAIEYIINNPKEAQHMGENGRRAVLREYNWKTQEKELLEIYEGLKSST